MVVTFELFFFFFFFFFFFGKTSVIVQIKFVKTEKVKDMLFN